MALGFAGQGCPVARLSRRVSRRVTTYYVLIFPYDTFGPGLPRRSSALWLAGLRPDSLDNTPPAMPTGLTLLTGTVISDDGTIQPWVEAHWFQNSESDIASYQVYFYVGTSIVPSVFTVSHPTTNMRLQNIAGNTVVSAIMLALDQFANQSPLTAPVSITTSRDTVAPGIPQLPDARGSFKCVVLQWVPPSDSDYLSTEVWGSVTNNVTTAIYIGEDFSTFVHGNLPSGASGYYWLRSKDTSGNVSAFVPGPLAGMLTTTVLTTSGDIGNLSITETKIANDAISTPKLQANSVDANNVTTGELITLGAQIRNLVVIDGHITTLSANKFRSGTIQADTVIGVGNSIFIDGTNRLIVVYDDQVLPGPITRRTRAILGKLGLSRHNMGYSCSMRPGY